MAEVLDPAFAGDFPSDEFRSAILNTMVMGSPNKTVDKPTFYWNTDKTYTVQDRNKKPYTLGSVEPVEDNTPDPVVATVAVEYVQRNPALTGMGDFDKSRAILTILDEEYQKIEGADWVTLGGDKYEIKYVTVDGLFDVDVYTMHVTAIEES